MGTVPTKLMQKMSMQAPPKIMADRYFLGIAKNYNVDYESDDKFLAELNDSELIDLGAEDRNDHGASGGGGNFGYYHVGSTNPTHSHSPAFIGYPYMPVIPGRTSAAGISTVPIPQMPPEKVKRPLGSGLPPFSPSPVLGNVGGFVHPQMGGMGNFGPSRYDSLPPPYSSYPTPPSAPKVGFLVLFPT